jgi:hypothetical protein
MASADPCLGQATKNLAEPMSLDLGRGRPRRPMSSRPVGRIRLGGQISFSYLFFEFFKYQELALNSKIHRNLYKNYKNAK